MDPLWLNSYWQTVPPHLPTMDVLRGYLSRHGFDYRTSDKLARLKALARRCARGHQSYAPQTVKMLRALVRERYLESQLAPKANKEQLIRCLEAADDAKDEMEASSTFHRFIELPPELRNRVYVFYFESLGKVPPRFVVPPLCRASRQLRLETKELFFEHSTFIVWLKPMSVAQSQRLPYRHWTLLNYHNKVARSNIPDPAFARIKHLSVEVKEPWDRWSLAHWTIDLTCGRCVIEKEVQNQRSDEKHAQTFVDSVMVRDGQARLKKSDLGELVVAMNEAFVCFRR